MHLKCTANPTPALEGLPRLPRAAAVKTGGTAPMPACLPGPICYIVLYSVCSAFQACSHPQAEPCTLASPLSTVQPPSPLSLGPALAPHPWAPAWAAAVMAEVLKVHRSRSNPLLSGLDTGKKRAKSEPPSIAAWQASGPTPPLERRRPLPLAALGDEFVRVWPRSDPATRWPAHPLPPHALVCWLPDACVPCQPSTTTATAPCCRRLAGRAVWARCAP